MVLFHGTSKSRFAKILGENNLHISRDGDIWKVSMSLERKPANYWANLAAWVDQSYPIVIRLSIKQLLYRGHELTPYSDPIYGEGKCDWEKEIYTEMDIYPLSDVMASFTEIPKDKELFAKTP
jgi:hypothetical protein